MTVLVRKAYNRLNDTSNHKHGGCVNTLKINNYEVSLFPFISIQRRIPDGCLQILCNYSFPCGMIIFRSKKNNIILYQVLKEIYKQYGK